MEKPTIEQLITEVKRLATDNPDNRYYEVEDDTYEGCCYNIGHCSNGTIGCIIGQAFRNLGFIVPEGMEGQGVDRVLYDLYRLSFATTESKFLRAVQRHQDLKTSWGNALKIAESTYSC